MDVRFVAGGLFHVPLEGGRHAYALMLKESPMIACYAEGSFGPDGSAPEPLADPLFVVPVFLSAFRKGRWGKPLRVLPQENLPPIPEYFRQNVFDPEDLSIVDSHGDARRASRQECLGLEREAVWEGFAVEERILDAYAGRPNAVLESLRLLP